MRLDAVEDCHPSAREQVHVDRQGARHPGDQGSPLLQEGPGAPDLVFQECREFGGKPPGVQVGIESGKLTALLVKGTGNANLKITLEWGEITEDMTR